MEEEGYKQAYQFLAVDEKSPPNFSTHNKTKCPVSALFLFKSFLAITMNILVFSNTFYPVIGGLESNTETLLQALQNLGHSLTLITATSLNGKPELNVFYKIIRDKSLPTIQKELKNVQLLIVNGNTSIPVCTASLISRVPYIIIYQMAGIIVSRKGSLSYLLDVFLLNPFRFFLRRFAVYHVGVSAACLHSKKLGKKAKGVLYNPISEELWNYANSPELESKEKKFDILFAGRIIDGKGVNVLVTALELLDSRNNKLNVLISGEGVEKNKIKSKVSKFNNVNVKFQDFVKGEKLAITYASSRLLVLPSTTHQEGSPLSIVEAFAFGLPAIVSDQPVMLELIGEDAGLSHTLGNANELSKKIEKALKEADYSALSKAAKSKSNQFTFNIYCSGLNKLLQTVGQALKYHKRMEATPVNTQFEIK